LRDWTFGRVLPAERNRFTAIYVAIVRILHSFGFYDVRNERYASLLRSLVGSSLRIGRVVVDLGCGPGGVTALMRGDHKLLGVDSDRELLNKFMDRDVPRVQARAERLPIRTGSVDVVLALSLVEHLANQPAFFDEAARVLKPGGSLVIQLPELRFPIELHTKWPLLPFWKKSLQTRILAGTGYKDLNLETSLPRAKAIAEQAGFQVDRVLPIWHLRLARAFHIPMGYFIAFKTNSA
jgi:SAM-dependent methyltransferase